MSLYSDDEDYDADVDGAELLADDPEIDGTDEVTAAINSAPVDLDRIGRARNRVPTKDQLFLELIESVNRLQQSHGDADPALSHALADIDAHLRVHVLFVLNDPIGWVLSILATMDTGRQLRELDRGIGDLVARKTQLQSRTPTEGDE